MDGPSSSTTASFSGVHETVSKAVAEAQNGNSSTNGSDTPFRKCRKRVRRPETWKRNAAKVKRAKGEEYVSPSTGEIVPARKTGPSCRCKRRRCFDQFSEDEKVGLIEDFNGIADKNLQDAHLFGLIKSNEVKRRRPRLSGKGKQRKGSYTYTVRFRGKQMEVCLAAFSSLYGVAQAQVRRLASASSELTCAPLDQRGKHTNRPLRISDAIRQQINDHIRSFPVMKSHYSRNKHSSRRKYLSPNLSVKEMHELYVQKFEEDRENPLVSYNYYLAYFNENFNMSFGYPKSDTCSTCDQLEIQLGSSGNDVVKDSIRVQKEDHLRKAENFYSSLRTNTNLAKQNCHIATLTFDFQQNLPLPSLPVGEIFYMHQLWLYVFGVHNCGSNHVHMYCWPETVAGRGSDEVISCLQNCIDSLPSEVTTLYLYSDGCGGQNKNSNVMHFLFTLVRIGRLQHIRHYFPVRGHSFLPNDRDFGCTQMKKRKVERVPEQWHAVIESARRRKPFVVTPVSQDMVMDCATHFAKYFKKSIKAKKQLLNIQKAMILEYSTTHVSEVWVKYGLGEDEDWSKFELLKKRATITSLPTNQKYSTHLPVKESKCRDLQKLVEKYVPSEYHPFYEGIAGNEAVSSETGESDED